MVTISPAAYRVAASLFDAFPRSFVASPGGTADPFTVRRVLAAARLVAAVECSPPPDSGLAELFSARLLAAHPSGRVAVRVAPHVVVAFPDRRVQLPWPAGREHVDAVLAVQVEDVLTECTA